MGQSSFWNEGRLANFVLQGPGCAGAYNARGREDVSPYAVSCSRRFRRSRDSWRSALMGPRITVVGSYATGLTLKVKRLPSPGETVLASGYRVDFGGKGSNQAVGCARLGAEVAFIARIGKDNFGAMAQRLYREEGIDVAFVRETSERSTGVGFILVEAGSGNNCIALIRERTNCYRPTMLRSVILPSSRVPW